jgi:predicted DNA-binding transcriptional regulator YafY
LQCCILINYTLLHETNYHCLKMSKAGKQGTESTLKRRIRLLDRLPVHNGSDNGLTADELATYLRMNQCPCSKRTVERDLVALCNDDHGWGIGVRLRRDISSGVTRWSHAEDSKAQLLKSLTQQDALLLSLLSQELQQFMPTSANSSLAKFLRASERVLSLPGNQRARDFRERIRVVAPGPLAMPPPVSLEIIQEINEALLGEEQLELSYRPLDGADLKQYRLHPVGLVKQGLYLYLVAVKSENAAKPGAARVQTFRADRMARVARLPHQSIARGLPTLSEAIDNGNLLFFPEGFIALTLQFAAGDAGHAVRKSLEEAPLSSDQTISTRADGMVELTATVLHSLQLLTYLQGKAHALRVVTPPHLKSSVQQWLNEAMRVQGDSARH